MPRSLIKNFNLTRFSLNTKLLNKAKVYYEVYPPFQSYNENGTYMAFLYHMNNIHARGKDNNSPEATTELIYYYESQVASQKLNKNVVHNDVKPNVICIMSEAYCDLNEIRELETSEPATPYYDSLVEGTRNGPLAVSIFGGGTCNTEFEFLTGYSMSSLLPGSSVYSFYINHETEALPALFGQNGYRTVALHSFDGDWWDRREKYPLLGFNEFYTRDDFPEDAHYVRRYISDMDTFHKITDIYEQSEDPLFLFCVTMQNHADFSEHYDNMAYDIKINNVVKPDGEHFNYAENYLSLLRESDDALKYLIEYLKSNKFGRATFLPSTRRRRPICPPASACWASTGRGRRRRRARRGSAIGPVRSIRKVRVSSFDRGRFCGRSRRGE